MKALRRQKKRRQEIADIDSGKTEQKALRSLAKSREQRKRREEKERAEYIAALMEERSEILSTVTNVDRINEVAPVRAKSLSTMRRVLEEAHRDQSLISLQQFILLEKIRVAEEQEQIVQDAVNALEQFEGATISYFGGLAEDLGEVDEQRVSDLWEGIVDENTSQVLQRGTCVIDSIDYHWDFVKTAIEDNTSYDWKSDIVGRLTRLYNRYNVTVPTSW